MNKPLNRVELQTAALARATQGQSMANYAAIFTGFAAKGIAECDIEPRVNVLTFNAWKAKGRTVRKGEHGVKVFTFIVTDSDENGEGGRKVAKTTTVFHVTQTDEVVS